MQSDEIKQNVEGLLDRIEKIERNAINGEPTALNELEIVKAKALLLNAVALNELNWSFYFTKEELKRINQTISYMR